jgi:hypothetical protein
MASHTNTGPARPELTTVITIDDAMLLFQPGAQQPLALVLSLTVVSSPSVPPAATIGSSATSEPFPSTAMKPVYDDVENGGLPITWSGGVSTYAAAANQQWARSEHIWSTPSGCVNLTIRALDMETYFVRVQGWVLIS